MPTNEKTYELVDVKREWPAHYPSNEIENVRAGDYLLVAVRRPGVDIDADAVWCEVIEILKARLRVVRLQDPPRIVELPTELSIKRDNVRAVAHEPIPPNTPANFADNVIVWDGRFLGDVSCDELAKFAKVAERMALESFLKATLTGFEASRQKIPAEIHKR